MAAFVTLPDTPEVGRRKHRRVMFLVAVVVVVSAAVGWWSSPRTPGDDPPPPRPLVVPTMTGDTGPVRDVGWVDFNGLDLPVSATAGPHQRAAGRAAGFDHSDTGAAFAAVHLLVRTFAFAGPAVFGPTIAAQVEGPNAQTLARLTAAAYADYARAAGVKGGEPLRADGGWVAGYRLARTGEPGRRVAPAWGDWRTAATALSRPDPAGYTRYDDANTTAGRI